MQLALGYFIFSLKTAPFMGLDRSSNWRHPSNEVVGARALRQYIGVGKDSIKIRGQIVQEFGNKWSLSVLRSMADAGESYPLLNGSGFIFGLFIIDSIDEKQSYHRPDGSPLLIDFDLALTRVDDNLIFDALEDTAMNLLGGL